MRYENGRLLTLQPLEKFLCAPIPDVLGVVRHVPSVPKRKRGPVPQFFRQLACPEDGWSLDSAFETLNNKNPIMENNPQKLLNNNTQEAVELLGLSSSDSLDSPSFSHFQAPKQKRKVRFKKPFRPGSRLKSGRNTSQKNCKCSFMEGFKIFSYFAVLAIVGALLWYVMTLSTRIQELQAKFADCENASQVTEIVNGVYGADTVTANYVQLWFRRFRSGVFDVKDAPRICRPVDGVWDEKWVTYDNTVRKRSWTKGREVVQTVAKPGLTARKDYARPHTSVETRQKLWELDWEVLMHPPCSPDLAPSDYHLFLVLLNFLSDKKLGLRENCENRFLEFFANKDQDIYERGIMKLPLKIGQSETLKKS
ncbi:uncharacterized protein TNCV_3394831 [Trichonephila clavipes]|nr:uncharacterized protein TNCV_3394831 [Trichonephila clavipes]